MFRGILSKDFATTTSWCWCGWLTFPSDECLEALYYASGGVLPIASECCAPTEWMFRDNSNIACVCFVPGIPADVRACVSRIEVWNGDAEIMHLEKSGGTAAINSDVSCVNIMYR